MADYELYKKYLGEIPKWLEKYLDLDILQRLKDISLLCGMDYASDYAYDFAFYVSRYDHSLNVALITWKLTNSKEATLAALFHDVSSPVFSHVIDYMNGDYINQESTEEKTSEVLLGSKELRRLLSIDNIDIENILDFKDYSIVDLDRPCMCADRLDNIIAVGMAWVKNMDFMTAKKIIDSIQVEINEKGEEEISFNNKDVAEYIKLVNDQINELTHTNEDTYMMLLVAKIIKRCIMLNILTYDELFEIGEHDALEIIEDNCYMDTELYEMWNEYLHIKNIPFIKQPEIKNKVVLPLVNNKRLELK